MLTTVCYETWRTGMIEPIEEVDHLDKSFTGCSAGILSNVVLEGSDSLNYVLSEASYVD